MRNTFKDQPASHVELRSAKMDHPEIAQFSDEVKIAATKADVSAIVFAIRKEKIEDPEGKGTLIAGNLLVHEISDLTLLAFGHTILSHPLMRKSIDMAMQAIKDKQDGDDDE